jgi:hypothetical protein
VWCVRITLTPTLSLSPAAARGGAVKLVVEQLEAFFDRLEEAVKERKAKLLGDVEETANSAVGRLEGQQKGECVGVNVNGWVGGLRYFVFSFLSSTPFSPHSSSFIPTHRSVGHSPFASRFRLSR